MTRRQRRRILPTLFTLGTATGLLLTPVSAGATPSAATAGSASASAQAALGVSINANGWIQYTRTLASRLALRNVSTTTVSAERGSDGICINSSSSTAAGPARRALFQEEIAFNPGTCQQRVLSGTMGPDDLATLNSIGDGHASAPGSGSGVQSATVSGQRLPTTSQSPAAPNTSYGSAHVKTAWIDPLNITITSLANNMSWPLYGAGGTLTERWNAYDFPFDGWSSSGVYLGPFVTLSGNIGWSIRATDHFTNTDFATFVYIVFGIAGWLACGAPLTVTAHFNHDLTIYGYRSGGYNRAWNDSATGACTDLVHHAEWDGYGWTS